MSTRKGKGKGAFGITKTFKPAARVAEKEEIVEEVAEEVEVVSEVVESEVFGIKRVLQGIAVEAFEVDDASELPDYVRELTGILTIDDADVFWEFASFGDEKQLITDFFVSIKQTLETRETNPRFRLAASRSSIPHYYSLTFESPLLGEERKAEEERDGQLLRKDKPVRGAVMCPKCGDNLISTRQLQLRGLDEPSTNIYTCYSCPNMWSV